MVPLNRNKTTFDLIKSIEIPVILIVGSYLGSLSHSLSTIHILKASKIKVTSIIVNESIENIGLESTADVLKTFIPDIPIRICKRGVKFKDQELDVIVSDIYS